MDFDEYVAARYGRLIEHAVLSGCAEGEAGTQVDRVLIAQRRNIRRSRDPDPIVYEALDRALRGEPERRRRRGGPLAALGLVGAAAAVGLVFTYQPAPRTETMPSLFGYDAAGATALLQAKGLDVDVINTRACEPLGEVVGSTPRAGQSVTEGATVAVRAALPTDETCLPDYQDRADAWAFVRFAVGGRAPELDDQVDVQVAGQSTRRLSGDQVRRQTSWGAGLALLAQAAGQQTDRPSGMPALKVTDAVPPATWCGRTRPADVGDRTALRLVIETQSTATGCPLTVDLYRTGRSIDSVVVYPAAS